ncbi:uncharacterized protein PHALS_02457 [Plasmopara halstedii]|uniref:Uncharacterized protein n=1 Tax=Plasmopara halstedii TaxID=4781 RepID=A0A0P1A7D5_PLAHL|nr:uncharacterized protein PHALS_02457 [Plasmopara halstedii]CEG36368.1 hypothetical protein PHALS_02457 [Plasmopara halstedii]|eukprot:XP_024572737.1 hypothetical protein PHALS_02457 [Plasmopara halstedii]
MTRWVSKPDAATETNDKKVFVGDEDMGVFTSCSKKKSLLVVEELYKLAVLDPQP